MQLEYDYILLGVFEERVLTGADIRELPAQNELPPKQIPGRSGLSQHEERLNEAALSHAVHAAQHRQRRAGQVQRIEALEVPQYDPFKH